MHNLAEKKYNFYEVPGFSDKKQTIVYDTYVPITNPRQHVAVLMGGLSREREVSMSSADGVIETLKSLSYIVTPIDVGNDIATVIANINPDVVFNALHGTFGEDGTIPALLDIMQIKYTHSGLLGSAIAFNKEKTRAIMTSNGIKMAKAKIIARNEAINEDPMPRPYVIKPISEGSSVGVKIVFEKDNFSFSEYEWGKYDKVIVEEYIKGREIQVAVVDNKAIGAIEIVPKGKFYDYTTKYTDGFAKHLMPAPMNEKTYQKFLQIAQKAHDLLGLRTISRSDFRYDESLGNGEGIYFLEINSHPGFTPLSLVPEIAAYYGISYAQIVEMLIKDARWGE